MEITKEIFVEGNLIEKSTIKLYYKGKFTEVYSNEVFIVYGYDLGWKNIKEQKMIWKNDCFYTEIKLENFGVLNFCFKNNFGDWDNNKGLDYSINIEEDTSFISKKLLENTIDIKENVTESIPLIHNISFEEVEVKPLEIQVETEKNSEKSNEILEKNGISSEIKEESKENPKIKNYTREIKKEKFKRKTNKKDKKNRHQKKLEKSRTYLKYNQSISSDEESLFHFVNSKKNEEKNIIDENIIKKEINSNKKTKRITKKERSKANYKRYKRNKIRILVRIISIIALIFIMLYLIIYFFEKKDMENKITNLLDTVEVDDKEIVKSTDISFEITERMLKVRELNSQYPDFKGWIEIEGTNINYPLMQGTDNDYYMTHDYKKEYSRWGSLFLDKAYDWTIPSSNLLVYGHNFSDGVMFSDLLKYADKNFYDTHPTIKVTTTEEDAEYEIIAVFYSRIYYKSEKNVFRYYFFVNAEDEAAYNEFVSNAKTASIYDTGKTAEYGDQLLTLSTCEYSQEDGRFAVVARKK